MPCSDVTEIVTIELDADDCLKSFRLTKETCSGAVGQAAALVEPFIGRSVTALLALSPGQALADKTFRSVVSEFLFWKQFVALQAGLSSLAGEPTPTQKTICQIDNITYGPEGTSLVGLIQVDMLTEEIKACGRCAGCK